MNNKAYVRIIAEIGVNHNGKYTNAIKLIEEAKDSGADAVKFQTYKTERLASARTPKVAYQLRDTQNTHFDMLKQLELTEKDHYKLKRRCDDLELEFISTPYDAESARFLITELEIKTIKTASANLDDVFLHEYLSEVRNLDLLIATGMSSIEDVEATLKYYEEDGVGTDITLLHCVSAYPCSFESINLSAMIQMRNAFARKVGYSDHSMDSAAAMLSVALGATTIERHFTLDKGAPGPDHFASSEPAEFKKYVDDIRKCSIILGGGVKEMMPEEIEMHSISKKSVAVSRDKIAGSTIEASDLILLRPNIGISARDVHSIVGRKVKQNISRYNHITYEDLE
ncbi:N-acetylneuraminate synthase family protein [Betaproteobacteria bacterium LSUCC0117]|nr:N-acetylneuraminate synthase family protein [Betaproteobacteria bacterium LSUCC0117]